MIKRLSVDEFENARSRNRAEPVEIWKARKFIEEYSGEELSLRRVAKAVNIHPNYLSERFKQVTGMNFVSTSHASDLKKRANFYMTAASGSVTSRSPRDFNRCRNSIACSKNSAGNRRHNSVLPSAWFVGVGRTPTGYRKKPEEMRCHKFLFLRILAIRVGFETNSMDLR